MPGWYEMVEGDSLEQGDLLFEFPVLVSQITSDAMAELQAGATPEIEDEIKQFNAIILTQSCDLDHGRIETATLCPFWTQEELGFNNGQMSEIKKGRRFQHHLLNQDEGLGLSYTVVEFSRLFTTNIDALKEFASACGARPRLISPYKEHLSQAFARYFMRVGLPSDIADF